jgi:hypothetical protein
MTGRSTRASKQAQPSQPTQPARPTRAAKSKKPTEAVEPAEPVGDGEPDEFSRQDAPKTRPRIAMYRRRTRKAAKTLVQGQGFYTLEFQREHNSVIKAQDSAGAYNHDMGTTPLAYHSLALEDGTPCLVFLSTAAIEIIQARTDAGHFYNRNDEWGPHLAAPSTRKKDYSRVRIVGIGVHVANPFAVVLNLHRLCPGTGGVRWMQGWGVLHRRLDYHGLCYMG